MSIRRPGGTNPGFTIIELLVASLLLGMLVMILTMVFNQSSISWRIGTAVVADLDNIRDNVAELREEADNAFIANAGGYQVFRHVGLWDSHGQLRDRACDAPGSQVASEGGGRLRANILQSHVASVSATTKPSDLRPFNVGMGGDKGSSRLYSVNVMSAGPDREFDTWDDIWSWPDDFE